MEDGVFIPLFIPQKRLEMRAPTSIVSMHSVIDWRMVFEIWIRSLEDCIGVRGKTNLAYRRRTDHHVSRASDMHGQVRRESDIQFEGDARWAIEIASLTSHLQTDENRVVDARRPFNEPLPEMD